MTKEQYERWRDFARRMARTCFRTSRRPSQAWIAMEVDRWFELCEYEESWRDLSSWDQDRYPNTYYR